MSLRLMGKKKGMTRIFNEKGESIVCTVLQAEPNVVLLVKEGAKAAVQLGAEKVPASKLKNVTKPLKGHFAKAQVEPRRHLAECAVPEGESYTVGQEIGVEYFANTGYVDVCGVSKGKGFQGVIKRHNYSGGPAAHGSGFHRTSGSIGQNTSPGRVFPGKKMAGHMGSETVTTECLKVIKVDQEKGVILVKGAVPGCRGGLVYIRKSMKRKGAK